MIPVMAASVRQGFRCLGAQGSAGGVLWTLTVAGLALLAAGCPQPPQTVVLPPPLPPPVVVHRPVTPPVRPPPPPPRKEVELPIQTLALGRSAQGRFLTAMVFGAPPVRTLVVGGIHGDEPAASDVAGRLNEYLCRDRAAWRNRSVAVMVAANPDGLARGQRVNANGVDLNRNFPARNWKAAQRGRYYGGPTPASEVETQAVLRLIKQLQPARIVALHAISRGKYCNNYDGPARDLARRMSAFNRYPVRDTIGYPTPGSLGSWAGIDRGIAIVTLELPSDLSAEECWRQNRDALLAALQAD
jgi:predicted deacylase